MRHLNIFNVLNKRFNNITYRRLMSLQMWARIGFLRLNYHLIFTTLSCACAFNTIITDNDNFARIQITDVIYANIHNKPELTMIFSLRLHYRISNIIKKKTNISRKYFLKNFKE